MNGAKRNARRILMGKPQGKYRYEDLDLGGKIILRRVLE
jgi:hypothetical protein